MRHPTRWPRSWTGSPPTAAPPSRSSTSCSAPSAGTDPPQRQTGVAGGRSTTLNDAGSRGGVGLEDLEGGRFDVGGGGVEAAAAEDAAAFPLGGTSPHTVVDAVRERVLEALRLHRALVAD